MIRPFLFLFFCSLGSTGQLFGQELAGDWQGQVWQTNGKDTFSYSLRLRNNGEAVTGQATSTLGNNQAEFLISGRWTDGQLVLQEVEQLRPAAPKWCLKYLTLAWVPQQQGRALTGSWTATGCQPGQISLHRINTTTKGEELPFGFPGRWAGYLSQSDRDYGFYFELRLRDDGTGTSHIVSEDAGGEATHDLRWETVGDQLLFRETGVSERTNPNWKWCLKASQLHQGRQDEAYTLEGDWGGYIEDKTPTTGACAPGTLFLTKPIVTAASSTVITPIADDYTANTQRSVKVDRVLQVHSNKIRLRVWDNGIVDGDVVTLFLNGRQILSKYRVNKRKWSFPVEIIAGENLLILHAEDLGDISPNTVAVAIDDGVKEQVIVLSSNLRESGAILIQPFELKQ